MCGVVFLVVSLGFTLLVLLCLLVIFIDMFGVEGLVVGC